ncbi:MAG: hypothetical protein E7Z76_07505 [Methanobrevibacter sp.]|nr:hypothetical protein [Methanobrevibacter sp.]
MLEKIEYIFPKNSKTMELFYLFNILFKNLKYTNLCNENEINIVSSDLFPKTVFRIDDKINGIKFDIQNKKYIDLLNTQHISDINQRKELIGIEKLNIKEVANKLNNKIRRIDHTGINIPTNLYLKEDFNNLVKFLSLKSNLYNYPNVDEWKFLVPATLEEFKTEITDFNIIREPRLELVHDYYNDKITIQIDVESCLSKKEVENLFPGNKGIYFNGLENSFKSIYLDYDENIDIRLDIRFETEHDDFETGEWFVNCGKRIVD